MTWQEDIELAMRLVSRKDQRMENLNGDSNDLIDEIQVICDTNSVNEYSTQFARVYRTEEKRLEYRKHNATAKLEALQAAFPEMEEVAHLFTITCDNPNHNTLKCTDRVMIYLDTWVDEGLITAEDRTTIETILNINLRGSRIRVIPLKPTDPPPNWPDDDE